MGQEGMPVLKFPETPDNKNKNENADYFDEELKQNGVVVHEEGETVHRGYDCMAFKNALPEGGLRQLEKTAMACDKYLSYAVVTDTITDHNQRRAWRAQMEMAYGKRAEMLRENRMRVNKMTLIAMFAENLQKALLNAPQDSEVVQGLLRVTEGLLAPFGDVGSFGKRYMAMPVSARAGASGENRYDMVMRLSKASRDFLSYLEDPRALALARAA